MPVLCQCKKEVEELMCRSLCEKEGHDAKMQTIVSCY